MNIKKNVLHLSVISKIKGRFVHRDTFILPQGKSRLGEALAHFHVKDGLPMNDEIVMELGAKGTAILHFKVEDKSFLQIHYKLYEETVL